MMRRLLLIIAIVAGRALAQSCAPVPMLPTATASGTLNAASCTLSDGTPYDGYRVVLPVRGKLQLAITGVASASLQDSTGAQIATGPVEAGTYTVIVNAG